MADDNEKVTLAAIAAILEHAGEKIILPAFYSPVQTATKADGSVVTETDLACQQFIEAQLAELDSSIAFLGEEMERELQLDCFNGESTGFWCLDPLDGTSNFATKLPAFGISLGLIRDGMVELACIHDPVRRETFTARKGSGTYLNGKRIHASGETRLPKAIGCIDLKRLDRQTAITLACSKSYRSQRNIGSCALEWAWLAAGRIQFIVHGGEKIWDFTAGSLLAAEAGCQFADFNGRPLLPLNSLTSSIIAGCTPEIEAAIREQISN